MCGDKRAQKRKNKKILIDINTSRNKRRLWELRTLAKITAISLRKLIHKHAAIFGHEEPVSNTELYKWLFNKDIPLTFLGISFTSIHAEIALILDFIKNLGYDKNISIEEIKKIKFPEHITVVKCSRKGRYFRKSKPCAKCRQILEICRIKKVTYSANKTYITESVSTLKCDI